MSDEIYKVLRVTFDGKPKNIICQRKGAKPSALVTLSNLLLLSDEGFSSGIKFNKTSGGGLSIRMAKLLGFVLNWVDKAIKEALRTGLITQESLNQYLPDVKVSVEHMDASCLIPVFESTRTFLGTKDLLVIVLLGYRVYHGLLPDPKDDKLYAEVNGKSYLAVGKFYFDRADQLEALSNLKGTEEEEMKIQHGASFLATKSELTPYGLSCVRKDVPEQTLVLLKAWKTICVLYKRGGVLHILETDEVGLEEHSDLMWRTLENTNGEGRLLTSSFTPINVLWRKMAIQLLEEERKEEVERERRERAKIKRKVKRKEKKKKERADKSAQNESESNDASTESFLGSDLSAAASEQAGGPSLRHRFMRFFLEYRKGTQIPYFMGQVEAMKHIESYELEFCYNLLHRYDLDLASSISSNFFSAAEDLRLCVCDLLSLAMRDESMSSDDIRANNDKIYRMARLNVCCIPQPDSTQSFKQFTAANVMYKIYHFENLILCSTSYIGRMMALGYLDFILTMHKSGWSWNGEFKKDHMFVQIHGRTMEFYIMLPAKEVLIKERGIKDLQNYTDILFPHYVSKGTEKYPGYFTQFKLDILDMPEYDPLCPEPFDRFQKYIRAAMFAKAPLARSTLVSDTYRVCESLVIDPTGVKTKPYEPLNNCDDLDWGSYVPEFCGPLLDVYNWNVKRGGNVKPNRFSGHTYWDELSLGRHSTQHMLTKKDGVHLITDAIIVDLILEHDLKGSLAKVVKKVMDITDYGGKFSSIWRHFEASETFDEPELRVCVAGNNSSQATADDSR